MKPTKKKGEADMKNGVKILMAFLVCVAGEFLLDGSSERLKLRMTKVKEWKNKE